MRNYYKEMDEHLGTKALRDWTALNRSLFAVKRNRETLVALLEDTSENRERWTTAFLNDETGRLQHDLFDDLHCALLNYLAAISALVDYSRRHMKAYEGTPFATEYQKRVKTLGDDPQRKLLQGLRNVITHRSGLPLVGRLLVETNPLTETLTVGLKSQELLGSHEWNTTMKAYIGRSKEVDLLAIVNGYTAMIKDVYEWLFSQWKDLHADDLEKMNSLNDEFKASANWSPDSRGLVVIPQLTSIHL